AAVSAVSSTLSLHDALPIFVTGIGRIAGRPVCVMANDPTVKAGSWGARTVEKIVRLTEAALRHELPVVYLVDSAGARITDQVERSEEHTSELQSRGHLVCRL